MTRHGMAHAGIVEMAGGARVLPFCRDGLQRSAAAQAKASRPIAILSSVVLLLLAAGAVWTAARIVHQAADNLSAGLDRAHQNLLAGR
jgi:hypothetical protein